MTKRKGKAGRARKTHVKDRRLYALDVLLVGGPVTEEFVRKNKLVLRAIQIRGDQTLEVLHGAIFDAFDREEEHMYEFQLGGREAMDPKATCYVLPMALEGPFPQENLGGVVTRTTVGALGLKVGDVFFYWFDFGDDWWHQINVTAIDETAPPGHYPKVTNRVGQSPPQYMDWDEDDDEEDDEDTEDDDEMEREKDDDKG